MGKSVYDLIDGVCNWIERHDLNIVIFLCLIHIGLSYMHVREAGTPNSI